MNFPPTGPKGPHRPQQPTLPTTEQGPVKSVSVGQKQIPPGKSMERKPLDEWKIDPHYATPILTRPSNPLKDEYQASDVKERVLAMLSTMEPDVNRQLIHRVSTERQAEMAERVTRVQKALGKETVQKAFEAETLLLDLDDAPPAIDITLNYVMALALRIQRAQDDIRAGINADRTNIEAWKKGLKLFSQLQDAWRELYPVVTDICTHEPLAFEIPKAPLERAPSQDSLDSGVGDLIDLDDPWSQSQTLVSPQPVSLPPAAEARISDLERQLGDTLDHLRHERAMGDRLQESQRKVEVLTRANQQITHQYTQLQKEVETLRKKPQDANPEALKRAEQQLSELTTENSTLKKQLAEVKETLKLKDSEIAQQKVELMQKDVDIREAHSLREIGERQFVNDKSTKAAELEKERDKLQQDVNRLEEEKREWQKGDEVARQNKVELDRLRKAVSEKDSENDEATGSLKAQVRELELKLELFTKKTEDEKAGFAHELDEFEQEGRSYFISKLERITTLNDDLETAKKEFERKEREADELHREELQTRDQTEQHLREEAELQKNSYEDAIREVESLRTELERSKDELDQEKHKFEEGKKELITAQELALDNKQKELDKLKSELETFEEASRKDLKLKEQQVQTLTDENQSLTSQLQDRVPKEQLEELQHLKVKAEEDSGSALSLISSLTTKAGGLEADLKEQTDLVAQLRVKKLELVESEIKVKELESQAVELKSENTAANELLETARSEASALKKSVEEIEDAISTLSSEKGELEAKHKLALESKDTERDTALEELEVKHQQALKSKDTERDVALEQLRSQQNKTSEKLVQEYDEKLEQEKRNTTDVTETLTQERLDREKEVKDLNDKLRTQKEDLEGKLEGKENENARLQREYQQNLQKLDDQLKQQQQQFERDLKEKEEEYSKALEALRGKLTASDSEKERVHQLQLKEQSDAFERERTKLNSSVTELEEKLEQAKTEATVEHNRLASLFKDEKQELVAAHTTALDLERQKVVTAEEATRTAVSNAEQEKRRLDDALTREKAALVSTQSKLAEEERLTQTLSTSVNELNEQMSQKEEQFERDRALAVKEQKRIEDELSELRKKKDEVDLTVVNLSQQLERAEDDKTTTREEATKTESQLRSSLDALTKEKETLSSEAVKLEDKLRETEETLEKDRATATEAQNTLRTRMSTLSDEKIAASDEKIAAEKKSEELQVKLTEREHLLTARDQQVESLESERAALQNKTGQLESELEVIKERTDNSQSIGTQTHPDVEAWGQELVGGINTYSRSGSTSGVVSDYQDTDLSDVDSVTLGSEILFTRPGKTGKGKELRLELMLENSLRRLKDLSYMGDDPTTVDIAFQSTMKGIEGQQRELDAELKQLEENESRLVAPDEPPSHSPLRKARIKSYKKFAAELESLHEKFSAHVRENKGHDKDKAQQLSDAMDGYIGMVNFTVGVQDSRNQEFHKVKDKYSLLPQSEVTTPEGRVQDIHISLQEVMKHRDAEVRDYVAGAYVKRAAAEILNGGKEAVKKAQGDDVRKELVRVETCLRRLAPKALPLKMGQKLGPLGTKFIIEVIDDAVADLHRGYETDALVAEEAEPVRGEPGLVLARRMIEDPQIRPAVLTLLTSLQETHEGVATDINYYSASVVGLKRIRDEFGLVDMPTMLELLNYAVHDLKSENSLLATEAQKRHRQTSVDKSGQLRKDKMFHLCNGHLEKETSPDAPEYSSVRGQSHADGVIVVHPHREVLDCFKEGGQVFSVEHTRSPKTKGRLQVRELSGVSGGLLNTFFEKAPGGATQVTNDRANLQCIQISSPDTQPEDIVFKFNPRAKCWQVNLGNALWNVDPAFNLDNPNFQIPFEARQSGVTHRDWIPLKSLSGETAILALRKVPKQGRYFLYQKGHGDTLVPRVIGSSNPGQERMEAQFFYDAAMASAKNEKVPACDKGAVLEVLAFKGAAPLWLSKDLSEEMLQTLHDQASLKVSQKPVRCPIPVLDVSPRLSVMTLEDSPYRQVQKKKQNKSGVAAGSDIKPEHTGSKLADYNPQVFGQFSVDANFELVGEHYIEQCRSNLKGSAALLEEERLAKDKFRREAFKELTVYKGCELKPHEVQNRARVDRPMIEGTPEYSRQVLTKVIGVNRDHQMRLAQGLDVQCDKLVKIVRDSDQKLSAYSDDELIDFMILEFEQGKIPKSAEADNYIKQLTGIMLARNDLEQSARLASKLNGLMIDLEQLERDAELKAKTPEYVESCQQWNLNMALIATEQDAVARRLDSYTVNALESGTRARMSFECRVKTVLRENQVEEVEEALEQITQAMTGKHGKMSRISQKGTGWGKSTIVQMLTDHACAQNIGVANRSVLVIAPESNQAELNITLGRYFAQKGMNYQVLDLENQYVNPARGKHWWTPENLGQIHTVMLGLSPDTGINTLDGINHPRAPVGVSVKNVQILMQLRNQLQQEKELSRDNQTSLKQLDQIADLVRESMVFMDEWDRPLMPPGAADLKEVADGVNRALKLMNAEKLTPQDIMQCHGQIVQGCKRKHMLSATVGSGYTAAVAAGVEKAEDINEQCHTDVFTTQQRFWHWLNCATPVYVHLNKTGGREQLFRQVVSEVGPDREMIVFDGNRKDGNAAEQAVHDYKLLSDERTSKGGKPRGVLYYDEKKQLHKYEKDDPVYGVGNGAPLPKEEEDFIKASRGRDIDVVLTHRESIGTDAPQGPESVGVYMGLLEQKEDGRTSLAAQQMGRMMRASGDLRKPQSLYVVVNLDALEDLPGSEKEKTAFNSAFEQESNAQKKLVELFPKENGDLPPEIRELVYRPLQVPLQDDEDMAKVENLTERAMVGEIDRLADNEWSRLDMKPDQVEALKSFKKSQWRTKKAYLMLTAGELARREVSPHTKSCERVLHKANVESHIEEVYASESAWLQLGLGGQLTTFKLNAAGFDNDEIKEITRRKIITAVGEELRAIPRRISTAGGNLGAVNGQISSGPMNQEITDCVTRLKDGGIKTKPWQALDEPAFDLMDGSTKPLTVRQVLVGESTKAFNEALKRTNEVIDNFYFTRKEGHKKIKPVGLEQIVALRDELENKAKLVAKGKQAGVDEAIKTQQTIEHHYQELMRAICWVGFDATTMGQGTECEKPFNRVCDIMRPVIDIPDNRKATTTRVGQMSWNRDTKFKGPHLQDSFLNKAEFNDAIKKRLEDENTDSGFRVNVSAVFRLGWKEKPLEKKGSKKVPKAAVSDGGTFKPVSVSLSDATKVKPEVVTNSQPLFQAVRDAVNAKDRQQRSDEAMKLCQKAPGTNVKLYEKCMDEILQQLLDLYAQYSVGVQKYSRREQERILQQTQLMQAPMFKAYQIRVDQK